MIRVIVTNPLINHVTIICGASIMETESVQNFSRAYSEMVDVFKPTRRILI
jgi:putative lipase involved disintegration of autophagic bodies